MSGKPARVQVIVEGRTVIDLEFAHCIITNAAPCAWGRENSAPLAFACQITEATDAADGG